MSKQFLDHVQLIKLRVFYEVSEGRDPAITMGIKYRTAQRYVQCVEEAMGHKLFDGQRRPKNLTRQGILLHAVLKKALGEIDKLNIK